MKLTADIRKGFLILLAVASVSTAFSQYAYDYKRSADKFYANGDYYSAADNYEKLLEQSNGKGSTTEPYTVQKKGAKASKVEVRRSEIVYRIAESYRQLNNYAKAEKWYGEAASNKSQYPLAAYWYGVSLKANGKFPEAEKSLQDFLASYKINDQYTEQAQRELSSVQFIQQQMNRKDLQLYSVAALPVNAAGADYAAAWNNNSLVFTSTRADSTVLKGKNKNPYVNNLYISVGSEGVYGTTQKMVLPVTDDMEQGVASFATDGNTMYFTRWTKKNGKNLAAIYVSHQQNGSWTAPELLGGKVNVDGYSSQQPQVTTDGKYLLFASDRPGGAGGFDLYFAQLNNGQPGAVSNFGKSINTKEDDQAPYYHQPTGTLVFATKGRVGMGGYDLFESKGNINSNWTEPKNLGYPVNSIKDDIYFFNKGTNRLLSDAYISSDRSSECCLQLFSVNKVYKQYVTGLVTDCKTNQPVSGANVKVSGVTSVTLNSNNDGSYFFEVPAFGDMQIVASKENYNDATASFAKPSAETDTLHNNSICLSPIEVVVAPPVEEKKVELKAYFDFAKYDLKAETGVLLDTLVALMKREPKLGIEIYGYTDKKGTDGFNINLSRLRAEACKAYLVQNGVDASRLKVFAKGECCEEKPETKADGSDDPDARQANRRVEFKIILQSL